MFEVILECNHSRIFTIKRLVPKEGSYLSCSRHESNSTYKVVEVKKGWVVECESAENDKPCTFRRDRLSDESYIRRFGYGHLKTFPTHRVVVYVDGSRKKDTFRVMKAPNITHQEGANF